MRAKRSFPYRIFFFYQWCIFITFLKLRNKYQAFQGTIQSVVLVMVLFFLFSCVFLRISEFCLFKYQAFVSVCCQPVPPSELLSVHLIQLITLTLPSYSSVCLSDFLSLSLSLSHSSLAPSTYLYMLLYLSIYISGYIFIFFLICFSLSLPLFTFKVSSSLSLLFRTSLHQS